MCRSAAEKMMNLVMQLHDRGIELEFVDLGGGLGIGYSDEDKKIAPTPDDLAAVLLPVLEDRMSSLNLKLIWPLFHHFMMR